MLFKKVFVVVIASFWTCVQTNPVQNEQERGQKSSVIDFLIGGSRSKSNAWPSLVAFAHRIVGNRNFFCGGSLVSSKHVVSAAHCFQNKWQKNIRSPRDFLAFVGKHNLKVEDEIGSAVHKVWEVILHEEWKYKDDQWDADIALIVLLTEVDLSNSGVVGIVCLPSSSVDEVTGTGTISGWGLSEESQKQKTAFSSTPNELQLPVVSRSVCDDAHDGFAIASSNRTFCAGYLNKNKAACQGDSGSGFYQLKGRKYNLAGIVSASLVNNSAYCVTQFYSIFTDVSKFTDWIENKIHDTKKINWKEVVFECGLDEYSRHECKHKFTGPIKRNLKMQTYYEHASSIRAVELLFGTFEWIFAGIGESFANLKELSIANGRTKFIEKEDFIGLEELQSLSLFDNQIEFLPDDVFSGLASLTYLCLSNNQIKEIPERVFWNLSSLIELQLHFNKIKELPENLFNNLTKLRFLHFSYNMIEFFPPKLFSNKPDLRVIYIFNNTATTIDFDFSSHPNLWFKNVSCN